jgi:hypothetical protein
MMKEQQVSRLVEERFVQSVLRKLERRADRSDVYSGPGTVGTCSLHGVG